MTLDGDRVVVIGWDLDGTARRRRAWRNRALGIWFLFAAPLSVLVALYLHPLMALVVVSSLTIPLNPQTLQRFRWARAGTSSAWFRLQADHEGVRVDHLFGIGCPPPARVLDPTPSVDAMKLNLPGTRVTAWRELNAVRADGALFLGSDSLNLGGVTANELQEIALRLETLRAAVDQGRQPVS